ncbi:hypothetical protein COY87_02080 [Candidatus Roizmanbacteria bacterium CG_4_10_14_0_8_um_filter_33_9]|uniref:Uncharacterized protein n=1 Tax=Candidatus Roizmanbacteria bacterium CG_4_10_14_0_8_um_filter_33_9 TaxID=1974826 RepID=A0A2M7QIQ3_9BACT|nr:MAG: hypothetical protein COY87_02080 [Candidatus Roizmanbacteria bacterium CG_4_10_14_0_8_um_filter_33_9]
MECKICHSRSTSCIIFFKDRTLVPLPSKETLFRIFDHITTNNKMANLLSSDRAIQILDKERALEGECKTGAIVCIDGRISLLHQF